MLDGTMLSNNKIAAIYDLREAVEEKVRAEVAVDAEPTAEARAALLDATLDVEAKTQTAIDVCHQCGHAHESDADHVDDRRDTAGGNVIEVDFGRSD
jgi:hypothetical protein